MNIFAVTYCAPPILAPATIRLLKWFNGLTELGHRVEALAIDERAFVGTKDQNLYALMPERNISLHRVGTSDYGRIRSVMQRCGRLFFRFLEPGGMGWYRNALRYVRSVDFGKFDVLYSCSSPLSSHLVARTIKKKTGLPWVAYFSDPWVDNPLIPSRSARIDAYNRSLEESVFEEADRLVFTSPETIDLVMQKYARRYVEKCRILPHCYVPSWYGRSQAVIPGNGSELRILHSGSFYSDRTAMPFVEAVTKFVDDTRGRCRLAVYMCGDPLPVGTEYIREKKLDGVFREIGTVSYLDSLALMKSADVLLLIDAPLKNSAVSVFLPSKLIDYLGSGNPVIGMTPLRGASARVLRETNNCYCAVEDADSMAQILKAMSEVNGRVKRDACGPQQYHYHTVERTLETVLREVV